MNTPSPTITCPVAKEYWSHNCCACSLCPEGQTVVDSIPAGKYRNGKVFTCSVVQQRVQKKPETCKKAKKVFGEHCCVACPICTGTKRFRTHAPAGRSGGTPYSCLAAQAFLNNAKSGISCKAGRAAWDRACCKKRA
eukprot:UN0266